MTDYFVGELRVFPYNRVPQGWVACDGQALQINQYAALYSLIGTAFGGDTRTYFNLPDLRGRVALGSGLAASQVTYTTGNTGGSETVALLQTQVPAHTHTVGASTTATAPTQVPLNNHIGTATASASGTPPFDVYAPPGNTWVALDASTIMNAGGSQAHENRQPVLPLQICIATTGLYPQRP